MSEEEIFGWKAVTIRCREVSEAGAVAVSAESADDGTMARFEVDAFGKKHALSPEHLRKLRGFPLHTIQLRHEVGYESVGGYSVYAMLTKENKLARVTVQRGGVDVKTEVRGT